MRHKLPPLNALRSFEAAARHKSFRQAAEELCVSHSAISHQVKLLENYLDTLLFTRQARSVELTRAGNAYYPILRQAFDQISEATTAVIAPFGPSTLTIQLYSTFAIRWLIPRLPSFQATYPDIQVRLQTSQSDVDFTQEDVELCVMIGKKENSSLRYDYLFSSELFPVASPALVKGKNPIRSPKDLCKHTLLQVYPSARDWTDWLSANGLADSIDPDDGLQFDSYELSTTTAVQGQGIALGMHPYVARDIQAGVLVDLFPDKHVIANGDWWLVCRQEKAELKRVELFRQWLIEQVKLDQELPELSR
ncbi:MAG: transcriptional regulator GcvA [Pseudohongiellaceae bacterium]|jgi:LysR family glycine cleavage system transcriptional activator